MTATSTNAAAGAGAPANPDLVNLTIDGVGVSVPKGTLVIRAAETIGIEIPRFCDHPLLEPVGACRQCLVDIALPGGLTRKVEVIDGAWVHMGGVGYNDNFETKIAFFRALREALEGGATLAQLRA